MPEQQRSGSSAGPKIWLSASVTQSVGVPSTVQWRSSMRRMRSGRDSVRLCEAPLISEAGATTYTSPSSRRASSNFVRPSECMPSSFVRRMRTIRLNRQTLHLNELIYSSESPADFDVRGALRPDVTDELQAFVVSVLLRERPLIWTGVFFSTSAPSFFLRTIS